MILRHPQRDESCRSTIQNASLLCISRATFRISDGLLRACVNTTQVFCVDICHENIDRVESMTEKRTNIHHASSELISLLDGDMHLTSHFTFEISNAFINFPSYSQANFLLILAFHSPIHLQLLFFLM